jgi:CBS domain containing-hemolysin-like protein
MTLILILSVIVVVGAAFCSFTEASLFSVNKIKIQTLADAGNNNAKKLLQIKEKMGEAIGTLVLLNNVFAVTGSLYIGGIVKSLEGSQIEGIQGFVLAHFEWFFSFFVILFGEIIPKNAGEKFALNISLAATPFIVAISFVLKPILYVLEKISHLIIGNSKNTESASEAEVIAMTDLGLESNSIEQDEHTIIQNVFKMNDKTAKDIMTPRVQIDALDCDKTLEEQKEVIYKVEHSRLPVFGEDYDDIIGFVLLRDVLEALAKDQHHIKPNDDTLLSEIMAVKETTKVDQLLVSFQKSRTHLAIVIDEYGGTAGIVTLEDVLELLVGEIVDETDTIIDLQKTKNEHQTELRLI